MLGESTWTVFFHGQNYIKSIKKCNVLYINNMHLPAPPFVLWKHTSLGSSKLPIFLKTPLLCGFILIPAKIVLIFNKINFKTSSETSPAPASSGFAELSLFMSHCLCLIIYVFSSATPSVPQGWSSRSCRDCPIADPLIWIPGAGAEVSSRAERGSSNTFLPENHQSLELRFHLWLPHFLRKNLVQLTSFQTLAWTINRSQGEARAGAGQHKWHRALLAMDNCKNPLAAAALWNIPPLTLG